MFTYVVIIFVCVAILAGASLKSYEAYFAKERKNKEKTNPRLFAYQVCQYLDKYYKKGVGIQEAIEAVEKTWKETPHYYTTDYDAFHKEAKFVLLDPEDPNGKWACTWYPKHYSKSYTDRLHAWNMYNLRRVKLNRQNNVMLTYDSETYGLGEYFQPEVIDSIHEPVLKTYDDDKFFANWEGDILPSGSRISWGDMISMNTVLKNVLPIGTQIQYKGELKTIGAVKYNEKKTKAWYRLFGVSELVNIFSPSIKYEEPWYIKNEWTCPKSCFLACNAVTGEFL